MWRGLFNLRNDSRGLDSPRHFEEKTLAGNQSGYYEVAIGKRAVYARAHGLASMNNCLCLREFLDKLLADGHSFIIVDLADCTGMDSTFMGVLAGAATYEQDGHTPGIIVVNADPSLVRLLQSVGLGELLMIEDKPFKIPPMQFVRLEEQAGEEERLTLIRAAHTHLIKISEENERLFGPIVRVLEDEMRKRGLNMPE